MILLTYQEYLEKIPKETKEFIITLLDYIYSNDDICIHIDGYNLDSTKDRNLYFALKAYQKCSEQNRNFLAYFGFRDKNKLQQQEKEAKREKCFSDYYRFLVPNKEEEIIAITPEEIIIRFFNNCRSLNIICSLQTLNVSQYVFENKLEEQSKIKKEELKKDIRESLFYDLPPSSINYLEMAAKIFLYKRDCISDESSIHIKMIQTLSLIAAIFHYNQVSSQENIFDEKKRIIELLNKKGLTSRKLDNNFNYYSEYDINLYDPTLVLNAYFKDIIEESKNNKKSSVSEMYYEILKKGINNKNIYVKEILGKCGVLVTDLSEFEKVIEEKEQLLNPKKHIEYIYSFLTPEVKDFLKIISKYYTYLETTKDKLNSSYISTENDLKSLAIFLSILMETDSNYKDFFVEKDVTVEKVLKLMKLPKEENLKKEIEKLEDKKEIIEVFTDLFFLKDNTSKIDKEKVTQQDMIDFFSNKKNLDSTIINNIYNSLTDEKLNSNYTEQIKKHVEEKEQKRKEKLGDELFANISIDVYNYLLVVYSYYELLNDKGLLDCDHEQLSIILGALKYDSELEECMKSIGLSQERIMKGFNINTTYYAEKKLDVDLINTKLRPYIFDRKENEITVYSIFDNAFDPKLTNSLNLRKLVYETTGKECLYFTDVEKVMNEKRIDFLTQRCTEDVFKIFEIAMKLHEFILTCDNLNLVETDDDIKKLSILLAIFKVNDESIKFFEHNGIDLIYVLETVGLPPDIFKKIENTKLNKSRLIDYKKYIEFRRESNNETLLEALLSKEPNKSQLLETFVKLRGHQYKYLVQEVIEKKERDLTIEEEYEVLKKAVIETPPNITDVGYSGIIKYGSNISKHSQYITEAISTLSSTNSINTSIDEINKLLKEAGYETPKKQSFFNFLFGSEYEEEVDVDFIKIQKIQIKIDNQIEALTKETDYYYFIKKYIVEYLKKMDAILNELKTYEQSSKIEQKDSNEFVNRLDDKLFTQLLYSKISTFEAMKVIMQQHLATIYNEIFNHITTINSLEVSKNAILPLLGTETLINRGKDSEKKALELTSDLMGLLQNVINNNNEAARENLEKIKLITAGYNEYQTLTEQISDYLNDQNLETVLIDGKKENPKESPTMIKKI